MRTEYHIALVSGTGALGAVVYAVTVGPDLLPLLMLVAAVGGPLAVAAAVAGRLGGARFPIGSLVGGATIGPLVAVLGHAVVAAFAYFFVLGFADEATHLLDRLQADPRLIDALRSPWTLLLLIDLAVVAPLTEEAGKALGAGLGRPVDRRQAFLAGVAAGVGFAIVENIMYIGVGAAFGGPWPEIALERVIGVAVHPLASGLVMLGWWDARHGGRRWALLRGFLTGAGIHALWNGSIVALGVVEIAFDLGTTADRVTTAGFGYLIALSAVLLGVLWLTTTAVAEERDPVRALDFRDGRVVAGWILLMTSVLIPATILVLAFPGFYRG